MTKSWHKIFFISGLVIAISLFATIVALLIGHTFGSGSALTLIGPLVAILLVLFANRFLRY